MLGPLFRAELIIPMQGQLGPPIMGSEVRFKISSSSAHTCRSHGHTFQWKKISLIVSPANQHRVRSRDDPHGYLRITATK